MIILPSGEGLTSVNKNDSANVSGESRVQGRSQDFSRGGGGGGCRGTPGTPPPLATPLEYNEAFQKVNFLYSAKFRTRSRSPGFSSSNLKVSIFRYFLNSK